MSSFPAPARRRLLPLLLALAAGPLAFPSPRASAQSIPTVEGVTDRSIARGPVTFRILPPVPGDGAGAGTTATLDGLPAPVGVPVTVSAPDFHELLVSGPAGAGGTPTNLHVRFIIRAPDRGESETGLPPWTPPPVIPSSADELAGGRLRLVLPGSYPAGLDLPLVAWLDGPDGHALRASAPLAGDGVDGIWIRRGAGSGRVAKAPTGPTLALACTLPGHEVRREIRIESAPEWVATTGVLAGEQDWPAGSRRAVTGTLTVPAGAVLRIGAGSVIRLGARADWVVEGRVEIAGTAGEPVYLVPETASAPWGGFVVRGSAAALDARHAVFSGSGAHPTWFDEHTGYEVHRREQALFLVDAGARVELADCAALDGHGQFGHGRNGVLDLTRTLVQRFITGGEYNGGAVTLRDSALLEFPGDDGVFADADNDAIYLTTGRHVIADTVIGWAKDDGIDAGSGGAGSVLATNVWVEGNFHEAFAWSGGGRAATNLHCVAFRCGQGIECGWSTGSDSPRVVADDCLSVGNLSGLRFGDNYDWTYNGFLRVTRSLVLHNHRDLFDRNWDDWEPRPAQLDLRDNLLTRPDPAHPANVAWQPDRDAPRLRAFLNTPPGAAVGAGFATRLASLPAGSAPARIPVALSTFTDHTVELAWAVEDTTGPRLSDRVRFAPGETLKSLDLPNSLPGTADLLRARLTGADGARLTGRTTLYLLRAGAAGADLVPTGSAWRYLDDGSAPGAAWTSVGFDDGAWKSGRAELGYGDGDEATVLAAGPANARHAAAYFRHAFTVDDPSRFAAIEIRFRRDDGGVVHLNGEEAFRSNVPQGPIDHTTYTGTGTDSETEFQVRRIPAAALRPGRNVVAAEVHQANATSSDLSFELQLVGIPVPRLAWGRFDDEVVLAWEDASLHLQEAPAPGGPWQEIPADAALVRVRPDGNRFYRLAAP